MHMAMKVPGHIPVHAPVCIPVVGAHDLCQCPCACVSLYLSSCHITDRVEQRLSGLKPYPYDTQCNVPPNPAHELHQRLSLFQMPPKCCSFGH